MKHFMRKVRWDTELKNDPSVMNNTDVMKNQSVEPYSASHISHLQLRLLMCFVSMVSLLFDEKFLSQSNLNIIIPHGFDLHAFAVPIILIPPIL